LFSSWATAFSARTESKREDFGIEPAIVTGPATDNDVGKDIITQRMGVRAINAVTDSMQLGDAVTTHVGLKLS
jgi:hypothetical protein